MYNFYSLTKDKELPRSKGDKAMDSLTMLNSPYFYRLWRKFFPDLPSIPYHVHLAYIL